MNIDQILNLELEKFEKIPKKKTQKKKTIRRVKKKKDAIAEEWKQAVWQYLLDHSTPTAAGYKIYFITKSKSSFLNRVEARKNGTFTRYQAENRRSKLEKEIEKAEVAKKFKRYVDKKNKKNFKRGIAIKNSRNPFDKLLEYFRKKIFKMWKKRADKLLNK